MSKKLHVILAWVDEDYREKLKQETGREAPQNPAGDLEIYESDYAINIPGALQAHDSSDAVCTPVTVCRTAVGEPACLKVFTIDV